MITVGRVGQAKSTRDTDRTWSLPLSHGSRVRVRGGGGFRDQSRPSSPHVASSAHLPEPQPRPCHMGWSPCTPGPVLSYLTFIGRLYGLRSPPARQLTLSCHVYLSLSLFLQFTFPLNGHFPLHVLNNRFNRMFLTNLSDTKCKLTSKIQQVR